MTNRKPRRGEEHRPDYHQHGGYENPYQQGRINNSSRPRQYASDDSNGANASGIVIPVASPQALDKAHENVHETLLTSDRRQRRRDQDEESLSQKTLEEGSARGHSEKHRREKSDEEKRRRRERKDRNG
ncbi:uncharacterized protein J7T54_002947 [Emericellopsis cladophorae]|uniref:Uncharacterized protein n=1 Tax=Emericellopsis cladophorae TaxID=2686198 RepID=A0A9P9XUD0_9HYPO|nr:uncharacterized protein J7T54_002947 [Emericellopsis cladophorae]KAI6777954.1 hypothetical protein J7T54_002947 [Emericellopsis cladophorae]